MNNSYSVNVTYVAYNGLFPNCLALLYDKQELFTLQPNIAQGVVYLYLNSDQSEQMVFNPQDGSLFYGTGALDVLIIQNNPFVWEDINSPGLTIECIGPYTSSSYLLNPLTQINIGQSIIGGSGASGGN